jgi:predicted outer membrane repeat protein
MLKLKLLSLLRGLVGLALALAALGGLPAAAPAQAAGSVGNGLPGSCDEPGLLQALTGGGLVTFNCGGPATLTFTQPITPTASAIIDGGGIITLSGNLSTRLFNVPANLSLTLRNLVLDRASSGNSDGGAIRNLGRLTVEHSTLQRSTTVASASGGALYTSGALTISDSLLQSNQAGNAGALVATGAGARVTLRNTRLLSNTANSLVSGFGGAIWVDTPAQLTLSEGQLSGNSANFGGAIYVSEAGVLTITSASQVDVSSNSAASGGGAL